MKIQIDEKYHLENDGAKGCSLVFSEIREVKKLDKKTKQPTGELGEKLHQDTWYFPHSKMALEKYTELTGQDVDSLEEFISVTKTLTETLEKIYKQFHEARMEFFK